MDPRYGPRLLPDIAASMMMFQRLQEYISTELSCGKAVQLMGSLALQNTNLLFYTPRRYPGGTRLTISQLGNARKNSVSDMEAFTSDHIYYDLASSSEGITPYVDWDCTDPKRASLLTGSLLSLDLLLGGEVSVLLGLGVLQLAGGSSEGIILNNGLIGHGVYYSEKQRIERLRKPSRYGRMLRSCLSAIRAVASLPFLQIESCRMSQG